MPEARSLRVIIWWILFPLLFLAGCGPKTARTSAVTALDTYVAEAKRAATPGPAAEGSLWTEHGRRSDLFRDFRARDVNDVVTIQVVESTQALSSADAKSAKSSQAAAGFNKLFGLEGRLKELPTMVDGKISNSFEGTGSTSRETTLQTTLAARVVDVLPNGNLVVEGAREIHLNNENQTVYLRGVVRPEDISWGNVVSSSRVAQMTVRVVGRGVVSQPLKPGWLYKILNGILPF